MVEISRRRAIEDVASELFQANGYAATSVRDIARALDLQGASLYAHVTSKEDVLWAIVERAAGRFEAAAAGAGTSSLVSSDPAATIEALVRAHVGAITEDVGEAGVFIHEWRSLTGSRRDEVLARRDAYEARFRSAVAAGIANGEFALTDPAIATTVIMSAMNGIPGWYRADGRLTAERVADHFVDLIMRMLKGADR